MFSIFTLSWVTSPELFCSAELALYLHQTRLPAPRQPWPLLTPVLWLFLGIWLVSVDHLPALVSRAWLPSHFPDTPQFTRVAACDSASSFKVNDSAHAYPFICLRTCGCLCPLARVNSTAMNSADRSLLSVLFDTRPEMVLSHFSLVFFFPRSWSFTLSDQELLPLPTSVGGDRWTRCACLIFQYFEKHVLLWRWVFLCLFTNAHWF